MSTPGKLSRTAYLLVAAVPVLIFVFSACSGGDSSGTAAAGDGPVVLSPDRVVSIDDLTGAGFKKSKAFNVEGLPGAVAAYYGFWGSDPYARDEYEARFYATHDDAVSLGIGPAEERTGTDAVLDAEAASWDEGLKEARACTRSAGNDSSNCKISRYGGYVVYGNLVLVCQGRSADTAHENCNSLLAALP